MQRKIKISAKKVGLEEPWLNLGRASARCLREMTLLLRTSRIAPHMGKPLVRASRFVTVGCVGGWFIKTSRRAKPTTVVTRQQYAIVVD